MPTPTRHRAATRIAAALLGGATLAASTLLVAPTATAAPAPATIIGRFTDSGTVDVSGSGSADIVSYGTRNRALSVGQQGGDGWNLRYVVPFDVPAATKQAVQRGSRARLTFTVWRTDDLAGERLVISALPGQRRGIHDFDRPGREVHRGAPGTGRRTVDVTEAIRTMQGEVLTFRFATDIAPRRGDGRTPQINVATVNGDREHRPRLEFTAPTGAAPAPTPTTRPPAPPTTTTKAPAPPPTEAPRVLTSQASPRPAAPAGMRLAWADEFDGSSLDTSVWRPYHNTYGDGNNELACLTPGNVAVSGGTLKIQARRQQVSCPGGSTRQFTSGFLGTRETGTFFPRYGRYEVRARVPHGQGLWPAFWLRHRDGASVAEVDVMEYFHAQVPGETTQTLHLDGNYNITKKTTEFEAPTGNPGWHTWAVDIKPAGGGAVEFSFLTNGRVVHRFTDSRAGWAKRHGNGPLFDMAINLAVGGNWAGHPDQPLGVLANISRCAQGGSHPNGCRADGVRRAPFPSTYEIDYVRVYELG